MKFEIKIMEHQGCVQYRSGYIGLRRFMTIERISSLAAT